MQTTSEPQGKVGPTSGRETKQETLFDLPLTTCELCYREIWVGEEATHPCFFYD